MNNHMAKLAVNRSRPQGRPEKWNALQATSSEARNRPSAIDEHARSNGIDCERIISHCETELNRPQSGVLGV